MLFPHQVIPFLLHEESYVRRHAIQYLAEAHDPAPATAEEFWKVIDRFGMEPSVGAVARLCDLPQTEECYQRTMAALVRGVDKNSNHHLQAAMEKMNLGVVEAHRDEVLACKQLDEPVREHLARRLELRGRGAEELWDELMEHGRKIGQSNIGEFDGLVAQRLIEAIARDAAEVPARALELLRDPKVDDWREIFAVQLVGRTRHEPAIGVLIEKLLTDADVLNEETVDALTRIGTVQVVQELEQFVPGKEWSVRLFADGPLERIKRPESEAALLRLLESGDEDLRGDMCVGLCMLVAGPEHLAHIRDLYVARKVATEMADLREMILAAGVMVGYEPPEARSWRRHVVREEARMAAALRAFEDWASGDDDEATEGVPYDPIGSLLDAEPVPTLRREGPKVGRNDPCPCGSGKKYKKCCMGKA